MVVVGLSLVVAVVVGIVVYVVANGSEPATVPVTSGFRHVNPAVIVRVPRDGVFKWMEYGEGTVEHDGRFFCNAKEVVFADPKPGELASLQTFLVTGGAAARAVRAQEAARADALVRRAAYLKKWAAPMAAHVVYGRG